MAKKVLIIEDDPSLLDALQKKLEAEGFEVFRSEDGETGLRTAEEKHPDLIILDLILPKKHGFTVLAELQKTPELRSIPVMVLTNLESAPEIERAFSLGVKYYLVKANYAVGEVVQKVQQALV